MSEADPSKHLEPPSKTTELEDPGAQDNGSFPTHRPLSLTNPRRLTESLSLFIASSSDEDHFSDASEGQDPPQNKPPSPATPLLVERVDDSTLHGELPGTTAYEKREQDAVPDEIEVIPEGSQSRSQFQAGLPDRPLTPGGKPIPYTMVEKVDPDQPSYGDVPGTEAYNKRQADAVPDSVMKASDSESQPVLPSLDDASADSNSASQSIPETRISRVDTDPSQEEDVPSRPRAHQRSPSDATPDVVETIYDAPLSPKLETPQEIISRGSAFEEEVAPENEQNAGDDFDEFVEEQDDDFGDFDDGFQDPSPEVESAQQPPALPSVPALVDFDVFKTTSDLISALQGTLDNLLPNSQDLDSLPPVEPIPDSSAIFSTERSLSLWSQLVAPPPLQPQNWVKSRIRRLFLVSLGVPAPAQSHPAARAAKRPTKAAPQPPSGPATTGPAPTRSKGRRGAAQPPELDLSAVRRLCATTDAALSGLTDDELKSHVHELEAVTRRASELLEYWLKKRDGLVGEKEAFEGVIENLVSHVRRVRK
ncbi:hypothetical protein N7468_005152 [Penicillium chermesinum]|uniref:Uncharacterized protein n=1 Tax=Penicillium chermesinum TaxID=63820 RepID=A0A9W9NYZ2_9EURO|nr:uncharacterized protein N7468_005152 [Penicillium chermesinum]KAJ5232196.1 hypothetical protein N7468_005152 [Penicillium chermesinum]